MGYVKRGTTPTHIFEVDLDLRDAVKFLIVYKQYGRTILEKDSSECTVYEDRVEVKLTQKETLNFEFDVPVFIEIVARFSDGSVARSDIITVYIKPTLLEEEL